MEQRDDATLLSTADDDPAAFRLFYERWAERVLAYLYRRTLDPHVAADLLAETFAVAWLKRKRFRPERDSAGPWLFGIARRELSHFWRRQQVEQRALRRLGVVVPELDDESIGRIEQLIDLAAFREELDEALRRLSAAERSAVELRVVQELSYAEVAARLGCSEAAARVRVHRGLKRLAEWIESPP